MVTDSGPSIAAEAPAAGATDGGATTVAALPFRPFVAPSPVVSPGKPTPRGKACRRTGEADLARERAREIAALDAALRKSGGMVLPTVQIPMEGDADGVRQLGDSIRGPSGERLLIVAMVGICHPSDVPTIAINRGAEVFVVVPQLRPTTLRTVSLCEPICGGCGRAPSTTTIAVEVPEGAHFVGTRDVTVPIAVQVDLVSRDAKGLPKACAPVP